MKRRQKLSFTEHVDVGERLCRLQREWQELYVLVANHYPLHSKVVKKMKQANNAMCEARSVMDTQCCEDDPEMFVPHIYYPGGKQNDAKS